MKSRMTLVVAMIAVAAMAVTVEAATGNPPKKYATQADFTTSNQGTKFEGYVKSKSKKCIKGRDVMLFYDTAGGQSVGSATSDADGNWEIEGSFTQGMYHVEVSKAKRGSTICKGTKSSPREA